MSRGRSGGGKILLVDDKLHNLRLLSGILTRNGHQVRAVISAKMALAVIKQTPPDLMLVEAIMPQIDGYTLCQRLKENPATAHIPVIFVSSLNTMLDKVKAFAAGGVDYIVKPFHPVEVLARVQTHLTLCHLQQQLQTQNQVLLEQNQRLKQEICDRIQAEEALSFANQALERLAHLDSLTQVANRRQFDQFLAQQWDLLAEQQRSLALLLCDVDYFKLYNDTYGHLQGDRCLQRIAQALKQQVRPTDLVARYGGEEFAIVLPNTSLATATHMAQTLRLAVRQLHIPHSCSTLGDYVTLSLGVVCTIPRRSLSLEQFITSADQALYRAKAQGRDRCQIHALHRPIADSSFVPLACASPLDPRSLEPKPNDSTVLTHPEPREEVDA